MMRHRRGASASRQSCFQGSVAWLLDAFTLSTNAAEVVRAFAAPRASRARRTPSANGGSRRRSGSSSRGIAGQCSRGTSLPYHSRQWPISRRPIHDA